MGTTSTRYSSSEGLCTLIRGAGPCSEKLRRRSPATPIETLDQNAVEGLRLKGVGD